MHYYQHNIGDYARDTGHLSVLEHGIYRLLMDWCYLNEKQITTEQAIRVSRGNPKETQSVLSEFFLENEGSWTHKRVQLEIKKYHEKAATNQINGKKGGRKPKNNPVGYQTVSESEANRTLTKEPITINQEPIKEKSAKAPAVLKPDDVDLQVWTDWTQLRKAKRAPITQTVIDEASSEAGKAGLTLDRFLSIWCARGSQGLQAEWLKPNERGGLTPSKTTSKHAGFKNLNYREGIEADGSFV